MISALSARGTTMELDFNSYRLKHSPIGILQTVLLT